MENARVATWFERNPKKTIFFTLLIIYLVFDFLAGLFLLTSIEGCYSPYYNHGLKKNRKTLNRWGIDEYFIYTNSLGFRDSSKREVPSNNATYRVVFIGDSFTEGVGLPYEKTFVGLIDQLIDRSKIEVFNAGVVSYSPKLYYLRVKYLIEEEHFHFNELYVFIDLSDVQDETVYENFSPHKLSFLRYLDLILRNNLYMYRRMRTTVFKNFISKIKSGKFLDNNNKDVLLAIQFPLERPKWTSDETIFKKWGKKGLQLAEENMTKLYLLCTRYGIKINIAIYPWPIQINNRELNSLQVLFWKPFAERYGMGFFNFFPDFINKTPPNEVINNYFIKGDFHWNAAGHELIAKRLIPAILHNANSFK